MRKLKVAVDLDGVIWDLLTPWLAEYNRYTGEQVSVSDIHTYDVAQYVQRPEILPFILERSDFWQQVKGFDHTSSALWDLTERCDLVIATATHYKVADQKLAHFFELFPMIKPEQIILTTRKDLLAVDVLIDDWEGNLIHTQGKPILPILISQPYNQHFDESATNIRRRPNLLSAIDVIKRTVDPTISIS